MSECKPPVQVNGVCGSADPIWGEGAGRDIKQQYGAGYKASVHLFTHSFLNFPFIRSFILVRIQHTNGEHLLVSGPVLVIENLKIIKTQSLLLRGLQPSGAADTESFSHRGLSSKLSRVLVELLHRRVRT